MKPKAPATSALFNRRTAGVLLHPTSLPGSLAGRRLPSGTIGRETHHFIHFLRDAGFTVWQMLPTGPTHGDRSPYNSWSAHAGNPDLLCLESLGQQGWWDNYTLAEEYPADETLSFAALAELRKKACPLFYQHLQNDAETAADFTAFCEASAHWLKDFSLFYALRKKFNGQAWRQWPEPYRLRDKKTLKAAAAELGADIDQALFEQYAYFVQWRLLKRHTEGEGIFLFGDMPIFVAHDSADVWSCQDQFQLDENGESLTVAGVPPDYFSETGQHWGNPHYHWNNMHKDNYNWWQRRLNSQLAQFDLVRIDHFRGLEAYWEIPAHHPDASQGRWVKAPGRALLSSFFKQFDPLPVVAENLGLITQEVEDLRLEFKLPGMYVLQFGFDGNPQNINLPHYYETLNVVYTGTHDNTTTRGWLSERSKQELAVIADYLGRENSLQTWDLVKAALSSVARMAIIPFQDWLELDASARMNTPGTATGNWHWQFEWSEVATDLARRIHHELHQYDRLGKQIPFH